MFTLFQIMLGGGLGAGARYLVSLVTPFPFATMAVNIIGSFAIGLAFATLAPKNHPALPILTTGFMGGFTTLSAFSLDTFKLVEKGQVGGAFAYVAATLVLSLVACFGAIMWVRA
ncbi:MAG: fluoride efflux transporter CrcB [Deltaproteobacteria bacterium]